MDISTNGISNNHIPTGHMHTASVNDSASFSKVMQAAQNNIEKNAEPAANQESLVLLDTNQGKVNLDIEAYLTKAPQSEPVDLMSIPLLLPSEHNINALSQYSEDAFRDLLAENNIPASPSSIEFDGEGKLILPADYPYGPQLRDALDANPGVEKALHTLSALASHYAGIQEGEAFRTEMASARSIADEERIVQKYSYLFDDNRPGAQIVLSFLNDGSLLVGKKGEVA